MALEETICPLTSSGGSTWTVKPCRSPSSFEQHRGAAGAATEGVVEAHHHLARPERSPEHVLHERLRLHPGELLGERDDQRGVRAVRRDARQVLVEGRERGGRALRPQHRGGMRIERAHERRHAERRAPARRRSRGSLACARWMPSKAPSATTEGASSGGKDGRPRMIRMEESLRAGRTAPRGRADPEQARRRRRRRGRSRRRRHATGDRLPVPEGAALRRVELHRARAPAARSPADGAAPRARSAVAGLAQLGPADGVLERVRSDPRADERRRAPRRCRARRPDRRRACARTCPSRSARAAVNSGSATASSAIACTITSRGSRADLAPLARQLVEALAVVVERRVHRRHLLDPAHEARRARPRSPRASSAGTGGVVEHRARSGPACRS